ncbi:MAG: hypothetical protein C4541_04610 [Candidatus Auribacter fodinae]|uniref:Uncharacterized protein n=1 Tax=Candidatus Auribacter fodinae TaxID=2093366 RepID=A0A3A4RF67_9BACT|nr:MAG: hypothetical protein C4541_04610 [Candidatus Auribacter fodinae]
MKQSMKNRYNRRRPVTRSEHEQLSHMHIRQKRRKNKAELKKLFFQSVSDIITHIETFNRIDIINEKMRHLVLADEAVEKSLSFKPGNHILRLQHRIIKEAVFQMKESQDHQCIVKLIIDKQWAESNGS